MKSTESGEGTHESALVKQYKEILFYNKLSMIYYHMEFPQISIYMEIQLLIPQILLINKI